MSSDALPARSSHETISKPCIGVQLRARKTSRSSVPFNTGRRLTCSSRQSIKTLDGRVSSDAPAVKSGASLAHRSPHARWADGIQHDAPRPEHHEPGRNGGMETDHGPDLDLHSLTTRPEPLSSVVRRP